MNFSTKFVEKFGIYSARFFAVKKAAATEMTKPARLIPYSKSNAPKFAPPAEMNMMVAIAECAAK